MDRLIRKINKYEETLKKTGINIYELNRLHEEDKTHANMNKEQ